MTHQGKRLSKKTQERIVKLHEQGMCVDDIAVEVDVVPVTVRRYIDPAFSAHLIEVQRIASRRRRGLEGAGKPRGTPAVNIHPLMKQIFDQIHASGLTYLQVAKRAGVSRAAISEYLYRGMVPVVDRYIKLAEAVGLEVIIQRKQK